MTTSTEELIESYLTALDEMDAAEDDDEKDDWSIVAANAAEELKGRQVATQVQWHGGRTTETSGTVLSVKGGMVYLETSLGAVEGDAHSMSAV